MSIELAEFLDHTTDIIMTEIKPLIRTAIENSYHEGWSDRGRSINCEG